MKKVVIYWFVWCFILVMYQQMVTRRFVIKKPDTALSWTIFETQEYSWNYRPYLLDKFLNEHVAWDSEFYLAIADRGYDNDLVRKTGGKGEIYSLNYAFFPFYPLMIRLFYYPFSILERAGFISHIGTLTLSAVVVSFLGVLLAFLSLFLIFSRFFSKDEAFKGVFYFSVFPSAFFMGEVYSEGLFAGLFFLSILLILEKKRWLGGFFTSLAFLTRPAGILLGVFYLIEWIKEFDFKKFFSTRHFDLKYFYYLLPLSLPILTFVIWKFSFLGYRFEFVEFAFFGRVGFDFYHSFINWKDAFLLLLFSGNPPSRVYYGIEFFVIFLTLISFIFTLRKFFSFSILSFLLFFFSITSGVAQGMHRYLLVAPSIYIMLLKFGRNMVFDRLWSIISTLLFGFLSMLFSFDMWAG